MNRACQEILFVAMLTSPLVACGGSSGGGGAGGAPASTAPSQSARIAAAQTTAGSNGLCQSVSPFYFELGDRTGAVLSGSVGGSTYTATSVMPIASASKWLFGAYVAEMKNGVLDQADIRATHMLYGYAGMGNSCGANSSVASCFAAGDNDRYIPVKLDRFNYDSGHFQKWGVDHGMGSMSGSDVANAYQATLGVTTNFNGPLLAGGAITTPANYATFLRRILNNQLKIAGLLGSQPTCTQPASCPSADYSPLVAEAWHYSVGHWVEDDPASGDGSFSSAGAFGFYPWVDSTRSWYGILARVDASGDNQGYASAQCGRLIRKAFLSGVVQ